MTRSEIWREPCDSTRDKRGVYVDSEVHEDTIHSSTDSLGHEYCDEIRDTESK